MSLPRNVVAVVLTFRRPRLATDVVRHLIEDEGFDPSQVIVVVNGEGGLSDARLEGLVDVVRLPENLGPAGGFRSGMLAAAARPGVEWIYLCEDDVGLFGLPAPRVEAVLGEVGRYMERHPDCRIGAVVAFGRDQSTRTGITVRHNPAAAHGLEEVDVAAWGSSLLSREVVDAGILPDESLFFGYEDFDYWLKMRAAGFKIVLDCWSASQVAARVSQQGRDEAFHGQRPVDSDEPWRAYYVARNFLTISRRHGHVGWTVWHFVKSVRRYQLAASRSERRALLRGLAHGIRGRTGREPGFERSVGEL